MKKCNSICTVLSMSAFFLSTNRIMVDGTFACVTHIKSANQLCAPLNSEFTPKSRFNIYCVHIFCICSRFQCEQKHANINYNYSVCLFISFIHIVPSISAFWFLSFVVVFFFLARLFMCTPILYPTIKGSYLEINISVVISENPP